MLAASCRWSVVGEAPRSLRGAQAYPQQQAHMEHQQTGLQRFCPEANAPQRRVPKVRPELQWPPWRARNPYVPSRQAGLCCWNRTVPTTARRGDRNTTKALGHEATRPQSWQARVQNFLMHRDHSANNSCKRSEAEGRGEGAPSAGMETPNERHRSSLSARK